MPLHMYTDSTDTVIAESPEDAVAVWAEQHGVGYTDETGCTAEDWDRVPDGKAYTLHLVDEPGLPSKTQTAMQWVLAEGRCHLGSTEY